MRNVAIIGIAGVAGFALAWFLLARVSVSPPARAPTTKAVAPEPVRAQPKETPAPTASVGAPYGATPATAEPPAANPSTAVAPPAETKPTPETAEPPADEENDSGPAPNDSEDDTDSTEEDSESSGVDVDRAADLLAEWMARQDTAAGDNAEIPPSMKELKAFDQESSDPDWSGPTEQQIEATLDQWLAALPDDVHDHIEVIHVECRETLCQILAADSDPASQNERAQSSQEWQQAVATLPQQPWWSEFGFVDLTNAVNNDEADGYVLYQTYLRREVKPSG